ncbi:hypothetical protein [Nocardia amikacinitolerans]|nr:hypothetical protein [Nocardia amikacinitolerans]
MAAATFSMTGGATVAACAAGAMATVADIVVSAAAVSAATRRSPSGAVG